MELFKFILSILSVVYFLFSVVLYGLVLNFFNKSDKENVISYVTDNICNKTTAGVVLAFNLIFMILTILYLLFQNSFYKQKSSN